MTVSNCAFNGEDDLVTIGVSKVMILCIHVKTPDQATLQKVVVGGGGFVRCQRNNGPLYGAVLLSVLPEPNTSACVVSN